MSSQDTPISRYPPYFIENQKIKKGIFSLNFMIELRFNMRRRDNNVKQHFRNSLFISEATVYTILIKFLIKYYIRVIFKGQTSLIDILVSEISIQSVQMTTHLLLLRKILITLNLSQFLEKIHSTSKSMIQNKNAHIGSESR